MPLIAVPVAALIRSELELPRSWSVRALLCGLMRPGSPAPHCQASPSRRGDCVSAVARLSPRLPAKHGFRLIASLSDSAAAQAMVAGQRMSQGNPSAKSGNQPYPTTNSEARLWQACRWWPEGWAGA